MSDDAAIEETKRFLIEQKVSFVNSAVNAAMLWWVSSLLFCGSVLGAVWSEREKLQSKPGVLVGLGIVLFVFFGAIAIFGFMGAYRLCIVQVEIAALAGALKYSEPVVKPNGFFYTEILTFKTAMIIGGSSFALIHIVWILFCLYLLKWGVFGYLISGLICVGVWILIGLLFSRTDGIGATMREKGNRANDDEDRKRVLDYVRSRPGQSCEEAEIKRETGVAKSRVRNLVRDVAGIDEAKLRTGVVCWNPPKQALD